MTLRLTNIGQLATCPPDNPQQDAGLIADAALVIVDGRVAWSGPARQCPAEWKDAETEDCEGRLVIPGLVDCHTHLCFGGWRGDEFEMRLQGKSYQEIAAAGGGIRHTVGHTRESEDAELARNDGGGNETAARDADDRLPLVAIARDTPGKRTGVAVKLVPGNGEGFFGQCHGRLTLVFAQSRHIAGMSMRGKLGGPVMNNVPIGEISLRGSRRYLRCRGM